MFKNSSKLLFLITLMSGSLIAISSNSWLGAWMGLEINLLSFIPLMINTNNLMATESSLKYFLTQTLASAVLLFSIIMYMFLSNLIFNIDMMNNNSIFMMINSALLLKMGAAPFHFWFPGVMEGLNWNNNLILMTWQKLAPLMLISYCLVNNFMMMIIISSIFIGSIGGLNQSSLRKILAFSSINHLGWMIAGMILMKNLWEEYFIIYSFLSFTMIFMFNSFKLFHINQTFSMFSNFPIMKFCLFMSLLSLGGLPPFLGFLPKWMIIQYMTMNNLLFLIIFMVCFTLLTLFYYLRICYSSFMLTYWEISWNYKMNFSKKNMKNCIILTFFSLFGLILYNLIYMIY